MHFNDVDLHIFSNATQYAPDTRIIETTYRSFLDTFGTVGNVYVWYNPEPNVDAAKEYQRRLEGLFKNVFVTSSLIDGYVKALYMSKAHYLFMLEHDWEFNREHINNDLNDICETMKGEALIHLRFNRFRNNPVGGDERLTEKQCGSVSYCVTPMLSNNPHIISRKKYIEEALPHLSVSEGTGSRGIEEKLYYVAHLSGAIYGPRNHPATVVHLDGSGKGDRPFSSLRARLGVVWDGIFRQAGKIRILRR